MKNQIEKLKKEKKIAILAHYYQNSEVQEIADYVGDSLFLARMAKNIPEETIIFCGVKFMAETAKILAPWKKIINPAKHAICPMADMVKFKELATYKDNNPETKIVSYVNSSSEVKSISDFCCTSSNADLVIESIKDKDILFVPDKNLGKFIIGKTKNNRIRLWDGYCYVHNSLEPEDVVKIQLENDQSIFLAHPECKEEVLNLANFVGSTGQIMDYIRNSDCKKFIIGTEIGIKYYLEKEFPEKTFLFFTKKLICENMKKIDLDHILKALNGEIEETIVDEGISKKANIALERMITI